MVYYVQELIQAKTHRKCFQEGLFLFSQRHLTHRLPALIIKTTKFIDIRFARIYSNKDKKRRHHVQAPYPGTPQLSIHIRFDSTGRTPRTNIFSSCYQLLHSQTVFALSQRSHKRHATSPWDCRAFRRRNHSPRFFC